MSRTATSASRVLHSFERPDQITLTDSETRCYTNESSGDEAGTLDRSTSDPDWAARGHDGPLLGGRPVRIYPTDGAPFRAAVIRALAGLRRQPGPAATALEGIIRRYYPAAKVVQQSPLAADFDTPCVYVFRDGSLVPYSSGTEHDPVS